MHNLDDRPPYMQKAYQIVAKKYGAARAEELFKTNQEILLSNEFI